LTEADPGFEFVEHTADVGVRGRGRDLPELFRNMARGLFAVIAGTASVRPERERRVELEAESAPDLLHDWLEELNALHQIEGELYAEFEVVIEGTRLSARVRGERVDPARHDLRTEVKAVTWHDLELREAPGGWEARVLLDI
jgi:SHS2 domain-containing protein